MKKHIIILFILILSMLNAQSSEEMNKLLSNTNSKYKEAVNYLYGIGVEKDELQALSLFKQSANEGNAKALIQIGNMYVKSDLIKQDFNKAISFFEKAIKKGEVSAYNYLGDMYYFDIKDNKKAIYNYLKYVETYPQDKRVLRLIGRLYELEKKYSKAYQYYFQSAKLGKTIAMLSLCDILKTHSGLSTIKNEIEYWYKKVIEINDDKTNTDLAITFLEKYYRDTNQNTKRKNFIKNMYKKYNNLKMGCSIASILYFDKQYIKSFDLAKKIYEENEKLPPFNSCISTLSNFYNNADGGIAKNIDKAISLQEEYFSYTKNDYLTAKQIANLYLKEKKDYINARKWYQVVYELTKDTKHLTVVDNYIEKQPKYNINEEREQQLYPIIDNEILENNIISISGSKDYNFFASLNKDIKIFDGNTLKYIRSLRGWIGEGFDGTTTSMSFDEKNRILYATGINSNNDLHKNDIIRGFNIDTRKIVKVLDNKNSFTPQYISVSSDGKYLLAINNSGGIFNIINTKTNHLLTFKSIDSNYLYGAIKQQNNDYFIYIVDKSNYINVFSINKERLLERKEINGKISLFQDRIIVEDKQNSYQIYNYKLNLIQSIDLTIKNDTYIDFSLSEDNTRLVLTSDNKITIFNLKKKEIIKHLSFESNIYRGHIDSYNNLYYISDNGIFLVNLDTNNSFKYEFINLPRIRKLSETNKVLNISFGNQNMLFDLQKLSFQKNKNSKLKKQKQNKYNVKIKYEHIIEIYNNKKLITTIPLWLNKINSTKIINDKYILVDIGFLYLFDLKGNVVANLKGSLTTQKNMTGNNQYLFTNGDDNIIHIWDINNIKNIQENIYNENLLKSMYKVFGFNPIEMFNNLDNDFLISQSKKNNWLKIPSKEQFKKSLYNLISKKQTIKPLASLYIKNEKDWIMYTPEGLFTYGGIGKDLLKYHQNQGLFKEAKIIENNQLFDKFYRPDLIKKILAGKKVDIPMDVKSVILNIFPPELKILVHKMINEKDVELTYQICDAGNGISDPKLVINGQAINPPLSRGFTIRKVGLQDDKCKTYKSRHTLYPGRSLIELKAYDKDKYISNNSKKLELTANYKIVERSNIIYAKDNIEKSATSEVILAKPNLYFLSLAVSDYEDKSMHLTYPVKDVEAVKNQFVKNSKTIFDNVYTFHLYDQNVTKENINNIFDKLTKNLKLNDTFVLYLAGHGTTKDGKYQFLPYRIKEKISIDDIKNNLSKVAYKTNKSLVMLDTCYSGAVIDNVNDEATKNRLAHDSTINYIVASSSDQVALEGYKDHGVFTYSVLDAFDKNDKLKVWGLADHVSEVVPKITQEKFQYSQIPQAKLNKNFILVGGKN